MPRQNISRASPLISLSIRWSGAQHPGLYNPGPVIPDILDTCTIDRVSFSGGSAVIPVTCRKYSSSVPPKQSRHEMDLSGHLTLPGFPRTHSARRGYGLHRPQEDKYPLPAPLREIYCLPAAGKFPYPLEQMLGRGTRKGERARTNPISLSSDCFGGTLLEYFRQVTGITAEPPRKRPGRSCR